MTEHLTEEGRYHAKLRQMNLRNRYERSNNISQNLSNAMGPTDTLREVLNCSDIFSRIEDLAQDMYK